MLMWLLLVRLPLPLRKEGSRRDSSATLTIPFNTPLFPAHAGSCARRMSLAGRMSFLALGLRPQRLHLGVCGLRGCPALFRESLFVAAKAPRETTVGLAEGRLRIDIRIARDIAAHQQEIADLVAHARGVAA